MKGCYVVLSRKVSTSVGLLLLISIEILVVSCDPVKHRDVLTFFFDGVESPKPEGFENGPFDPCEGLAQAAQAPLWYVHEPVKNCTNCHDTAKQSPGQPYLIAPPPKLCYGCHDDFAVSAKFVHGPVAAGVCLLCHHQHKTRIEHLLKYPMPELCYQCHQIEDIESGPDHLGKQLSTCTDCHYPHASSEKALLKELSQRRDRTLELTGMLNTAMQAYVREPEKDDPQLHEKMQKNADLFYLSMDLYREGKLVRAREGFVRVLKSGFVPAAMNKTILGYLLDIDKKLVEERTPPD